jgi:TonB family protein
MVWAAASAVPPTRSWPATCSRSAPPCCPIGALPLIIQQNPDLVAVVDVWLSEAGRYRSADVLQGSGNDSFDRSCLHAVAKAGSFPVPPDKFRIETRKGLQIRVTFQASDANR